MGNAELESYSKHSIARALGIKEENVYLISQPNFHIDLAIRPLTYPYVLLGDCKLTAELISAQYQSNKLNTLTKLCLDSDGADPLYGYASIETIEKELIKQDFIPIRVPGLLGPNIANYMNAVVHIKPNGDLIYITNDCKPYNYQKDGININQLFKRYLIEKVPKIKKVEFISGGSSTKADGSRTYMNSCLARNNGGIHCMTSERPDFVKWNAMA